MIKILWLLISLCSIALSGAYCSGSTYAGYRDYNEQVKTEEKEVIRYILKTISQKSLAYLLTNKSSVERAGESIDYIHPLRFLESIFSDEELKTYMHGVKERGGWVWRDFMKALKERLEEEADIGNMGDAILINFASVLNINPNLFYSFVQERKWEHFIKVLLKEIPRNGDNRRYDQ